MNRRAPTYTVPPLDPDFQPAVLFNHHYVAAAKATCRAVPLVLGLERENGLISRYETVTLPSADEATARYVERLVKFLLWSRGGWRLFIGGPKPIADFIRKTYSRRGARRFDVEKMSLAYGRDFEVVLTSPEKVPAAREVGVAAGSYRRGCRIGFDLSSTAYRVSGVRHGNVVFEESFDWDPRQQSNLDYHYHHITAALHRAAAHLPKVDAIGVSSTGIVVDNGIRIASLFRSVPRELQPQAADLFKRIQQEWHVPLVVMNDGDVAVLAGALSLDINGMLGIAMDAAEAAGYTDRQGRVMGWLNELAFVPVDYNPDAPADDWSGDRGAGILYLSQQAISRLMPVAGISVSEKMSLAERLKHVHSLMLRGDKRAARIYETVGVYLGYTLALCADFYDFNTALVLGSVMDNSAGRLTLARAKGVLDKEFPDLAARIELRVPDEKSGRVGQAVAAASLPALAR
jgi:predicted NBD/HSP70 family sugar kinase